MLDTLRSRFELQGLAIAQLPETLENQLLRAGQALADSLLNEHKIILLGQGDALAVAKIFAEEMTDSSSIERPPLPTLLIEAADSESAQRQLQAVGKAGDMLVVMQSSKQQALPMQTTDLVQLCQLAQSLGIESIALGNTELSGINLVDCITLTFNQGSRMDFLCSMTCLSLTLASLVDYHLFGQPF